MKNKFPLSGIILILIGIFLILNTLDIVHFKLFFKGWWALFIIVPGLYKIFKEHEYPDGLILLLIGGFLLSASQGLITYDTLWKLVLPIILIFIGINIIFDRK